MLFSAKYPAGKSIWKGVLIMYKPTVRSVRRAYTQLNRLLFRDRLPASRLIDVRISYIKLPWWAYCQHRDSRGFKIHLLPSYRSRDFFMSILAHEMVHVDQYIRYQNMTHGPTFFRFRKVFQRNGLVLKRAYACDIA